MTPTSVPSQTARLTDNLAICLEAALNGLTGGAFSVSSTPESTPSTVELERPLAWRQDYSLAEGATIWMVAGEDLWSATGKMILGGAGIQSATEDDYRSTWNEIAAQALTSVARTLAADTGRPVSTRDGPEDSSLPPAGSPSAILDVRNSGESWKVQVAWSEELARDYVIVETPEEDKSTTESSASRTLDLLMDVALPVSVSFGRTSLQIREVLKLNTGSVVELDRLVSDPVEVIVNNCVIARGEVVVVEGNYGVRITHLASRETRLRSGMNEVSMKASAGAR